MDNWLRCLVIRKTRITSIVSSTNDEVVTYLKEQSSGALLTTYEIIGARIDKFGVTQPRRVLNEEEGRVTVELPGVDNPERVRKLLKSTAELEFYRTYTLAEIAPLLQVADKALEASLEAEGVLEGDDNSIKPASPSLQGKDSTTLSQLNNAPPTLQSADPNDSGNNPVSQLPSTPTEVDSMATDTAGTQPLLRELFSLNQPQGNAPVMGFVRIRDTAKVNKLLARPEVRENLPPDLKPMWTFKSPFADEFADVLQLVALQAEGLEGQDAALAGDVIVDARADIDPQSSGYVVSMRMDNVGSEEWRKITNMAAVDNRSVAIVLDDRVYSFPTVNEEISGGSSQISGNFTAEEARDLANILKTGKLPVQLEIINEAVVGPSLGAENINRGMWSLLVGLLAVIVFMVVYYSRSGWVANLALLINLFFIVGILASLQAALTLPGMAGIVLTLGMAVDANVLIYERIREELRQGKAMRMAVAEGFRHATSAIIDGNITTLLIGIILLTFGSGPIYGFAVVLVIGILTSLFTAILISRLVFDWLLDKDKKINFGTKATNNLMQNVNYDFVGKRKISYIVSGVIIVAGIISLLSQGLNYGVDFKGGYSYTVDFENNVNTQEVRNVLTPAFGNKAPEVKNLRWPRPGTDRHGLYDRQYG